MAFINIEKIFDTCILFLTATFVNSIFYSQMPRWALHGIRIFIKDKAVL